MVNNDYTGEQFDNYRLIRKIGTGGFADVYLGEHQHLKRFAAIKVLNSQLTSNEADKFLQEALMLVSLSHQYIVQVYDFKEQAGALPPFLIMEYASCGTLARFLGKSNDPATFLPFIEQIADALQFVHSKNLMHLDVKPENILFRSEGEAF